MFELGDFSFLVGIVLSIGVLTPLVVLDTLYAPLFKQIFNFCSFTS
jgi:hypothetical protein